MSKYVGTPHEAQSRAYYQAYHAARWRGYQLVSLHTTLTTPTQAPAVEETPQGHQIAHCGQWWTLDGLLWTCPACGTLVLG